MRKIFIVILTLLSQQLSFCQWRPWAWQCQFTMLLLLQSWHWQTPHFIPLSFFNAIVVSTLTRLLAGTPQPQAWKKHILTSPTMADSCFNKLMIQEGYTGGTWGASWPFFNLQSQRQSDSCTSHEERNEGGCQWTKSKRLVTVFSESHVSACNKMGTKESEASTIWMPGTVQKSNSACPAGTFFALASFTCCCLWQLGSIFGMRKSWQKPSSVFLWV